MSDTLLPSSATAQERALESATARVSDVPVLVREHWNPDTCPAAQLPWLAWAFSVDEWDPNWTDAQKRAAIQASVGVHRTKGTPGAMKRALAPLGLDIDVNEWHQLTPKGDPYTFKLTVTVGDDGIPSASAFDTIVNVAEAAKNIRSRMTGIDIAANPAGQINFGGVVLCGEIVTIAAG